MRFIGPKPICIIAALLVTMMAFVQPRLARLPPVFITLDDASHDTCPSRQTLRRSRSFSGYTPFEPSDADHANFQLDSSTGVQASETPVVWPDTDDEAELPSAFVALGPWQGPPVWGSLLPTPLAFLVPESSPDEMMGGDVRPAAWGPNEPENWGHYILESPLRYRSHKPF